MIALHEQEIEERVWLSTDAREELPFLSPLDEQDERRPMVAHDDDVFKALEQDERRPMVAHDDDVFKAVEQDDTTWDDTDAEEAPLEDDSGSEMALDAEG